MLSHKYKSIFVHIPKVAGQSIERVFLDLNGLTWEGRAPLLLRPNDNPDLGPPRLAHLMASEYVSCGHVSREEFDAYFKFSFVRNPWSRIVSVYKYLGFSEDMPFKQFLTMDFSEEEDWEPRLMVRPQSEYLLDADNRLLVDFVGRFEDLQAGFDEVCRSIGIPETVLPYVNRTDSDKKGINAIKEIIKQFSPFHRKYDDYERYTEYYDEESIQIVANTYARDIEAFNYSFGE